MNRKRTLPFPLLALVLTALACGGANPVTIEEIGVFPGATPADDGDLVADSLAESIKQGAGQEAVDVEVRVYRLPEGTAWEQVSLFYTSELAGGDWSPQDDLIQQNEFISTMGWSRGGLMSPQIFVASYAPDPLGGPPYLIAMLFSR